MHSKTSKTTLICIFIAAISSVSFAQTTLFGLGDNSWDISVTAGAYTQNATATSWQGNMQDADFVGGGILDGPLDLSSYTVAPWQFAIQMSIIGADPLVTFTAEFFDEDFNAAAYAGSTDTIISGLAPLTFSSFSDPAFSFTSIIGFQITWNFTGSQAGSTVVATNVVAVPEPSSALLLGLGAAGLYWLRRRRQSA